MARDESVNLRETMAVTPTSSAKLHIVSACRSDMLDNGIDLYARDHRELCGLVRRNLDAGAGGPDGRPRRPRLDDEGLPQRGVLAAVP